MGVLKPESLRASLDVLARLNRFGHGDRVCFCGELAGLDRSCLFHFKRLWYVALAGLSGVGSALQGATG